MNTHTEPKKFTRPVIIVAGGPSVTLADIRLIGMARNADAVRVITVNDAVYPCWFADIAYAADAHWWEHHFSLPNFPGNRACHDHKADPKTNDLPDTVTRLQSNGVSGFDHDRRFIKTGGSSAYGAVHIAINWGAKRIILVGVDLGYESQDHVHWYGNHTKPEYSMIDPTESLFGRWRQHFNELSEEIAGSVEIINVSPTSTLTCFPKMSLKEAISETSTSIKNLIDVMDV